MALDGHWCRGRVEVRRPELEGGAIQRQVDGGSICIQIPLRGSLVHDAITKHWSGELRGSWRDEGVDLCHEVVATRNSIVDAQIGAFDVRCPDQARPWLIIEGSDGAMADAENICILLRRVSHFVEIRNAVVAGELEHMSLILDNVDIDVATLERVNASTRINGVLVLIDLNDVVELVRSVLVASEVVEVEPVGLTTLSCDNTNALDVSTGELTGKELQRRCAKVCSKSAWS